MKRIYYSIIILTGILAAQDTPLQVPELQIGIDEKLGQYVDLDTRFITDTGDSVRFGDLLTKPTVLSLVYYRCPGICSAILTGEADVLTRVDLVPGVDFNAVTVSFNHEENWELGRDKKKNYLNLVERNIDPASWKFLVGDSVNIARLTQSVGFKFMRTGKEFAHTGALIILAEDGKIIRYLNGTEFMKFDLKMAIAEALAGRPGPTITKVLAYCFSYDEAGRQYIFNYTRVAGTIILLLLGIFVGFLVIRRSRKTLTD